MKKTSLTANRPSKGPVRISHLGTASASGGNDGQARPSLVMSKIPVKSGRPSNDNNLQSAPRQSRLPVQDPAKKSVARRSRSSAAVRTSSTPSSKNSVGKNAQTPHFGETRRSQSAHSPFTPNVFMATTGKKTDPRPINDKAFQQRAMVKVYNYFNEQRPNLGQICPKPGTRSIMIKTFYELVTQLLVKFFPDATINGSNYTTEIPLLMRILKYPGNLSSSWLKSANTMHSWPHVVALLSWLVDMVKGLDADLVFDERDRNELYSNEEFFNYVKVSFFHWNNNNDTEKENTKKEFLNVLQQRANIDENEFRRVQTCVEELEAELNNPEERAAIAHEQDLEDQCKKAKYNDKKLHEALEMKSRNIKALKEAVSDEQDTQTSLENRKPLLLKELDELKKTIASQKISKSQFDEIKEGWNALDIQLEQQTKYKENIEALFYDSTLKSGRLQKQLQKWSLDYNTAILTIGLNNPELVQLDMKFKQGSLQKWQETATAFQLLIDARKQSIENLNVLQQKLASREQERKEEMAKTLDQFNNMCSEETALKNQMKNILAEHESKKKKMNGKISSLEAAIQDLLKAECQLSELEAELQAAKEKESQCKKECEECQVKGVDFLKYYKNYLQQTLEKIYADLGHEDIVYLRSLGEGNSDEH